jgi:putative transposase
MIDRGHKLPLICQAKAVGTIRSSVYYKPRLGSDADLRLMRRIDELHLDHTFADGRMMRDLLRQESLFSGRRHVFPR